MAFVCDLKSDQNPPKPDDEDLEDGEIEDDEEDVPVDAPDNPDCSPSLANAAEAPTHKDKSSSEKSSSKESSKESRKERKSSRHEKYEKKHMTEAEKSVLYLHKMERLEREKRDKYRREQVHTRRSRGGSTSPPPANDGAPSGTADPHHHALVTSNTATTTDDDVADEDFATSLQRVLQNVLKKDKSAQAQAAVAGVDQAQQQHAAAAVSSSNATGSSNAYQTAAGGGTSTAAGGNREVEAEEADDRTGGGRDDDDEQGGDQDEISNKRLARRRKRERKKAVKRARLEAVFSAALGNDVPQLNVNDPNTDSANVNNGTSLSHMNNNKMDTGDDIIPSECSSSDEEHGRRDRRSRGDRRCSRKLKRKYRSAERDNSGIGGGTPTKVKKGETKLGLCLSYIQGKCMNRDCPYSHEYSPHMKMELCKFYLMECCAKGDKCYYLHKEFPCKYYHTGMPCVDGDKCKFNHGKPLSDSFRLILCKHIETAPKEILGDFPRFNREDAMNMIAITQKKLEEKYSKKEESKDNDKDDKRDAKRNRPSRWQEPDKNHEQTGSVVNLSFLHDKDQDMRFSSNGDIDMRTLPTATTTTTASSTVATIPLPATINTSTPPPNIITLPSHNKKQLSPKQHTAAISPNNHKANVPLLPLPPPISTTSDPQALLQQLGVSSQTAAALLLAGAQSGAAGAAAVAALLQSMGRSQQAQVLAGAPIVAVTTAGAPGNVSNNQPLPPPQLPITMQIPPPQLNTNAILFSTPPPPLLTTPPPVIRPSNIGKAPPPVHQKPQHSLSTIKPTTKSSATKDVDSIAVNAPLSPTTLMNGSKEDRLIKKEKAVMAEAIFGVKVEIDCVNQEVTDDSDMLDIERYKREAGIGRIKIEKEDVKMEVKEDMEDEDEETSLRIDCDPPLSDTEQSKPKEASPKPELPNLPRAQMDLFLRIQSQQAKSSTSNSNERSPKHTDVKSTVTSTMPTTHISIKDMTSHCLNIDRDTSSNADCDPNSTIDWYSDDDDDDDDDDDNKLTIGEDADPYDDIITKTVDLVPKSSVVSKNIKHDIGKSLLQPPVVEVVPRAEQIVEQLGDLSKIDISAEVTKLLTSISGGNTKISEETSSSTSSIKPFTNTAPTDPRTSSTDSKTASRSTSDPRTDPRTATHYHRHHHHHHHHRHHRRSSDASSGSPNMSPTAACQPCSSDGGRADPRRRRSSAESSDGGRSSSSDGKNRVPMPSIYDQATASFRMSNKDLDLRLSGSVTAGEAGDEIRAKLADVDLRSVSQGGRPDIDLRATMPQQLSLPLQFKAAIAAYTPATEIDATYHASYVWKIYEVDVPRPDYSGLRLTEAEARSTGDPRLEKIFRLASGGTGYIKSEANKEQMEFTIDESPASPVREQPATKPSTPRTDPRRRKPMDETLSSSNPPPSDPTQLTYAQQLTLLQTSNFYQNLTSNQKLNLNHELSQRMQQSTHHHSQHHAAAHLQHQQQGSNDPLIGAVLQSLGLTGRHMGIGQQQQQQQQMMLQLQQYGAFGLLQQVQQQQGGAIGGGGGGGDHRSGGGGSRSAGVGMMGHGGVPNNQQGLLGAAPGVPHDFINPVQQTQAFLGGPPNLHPNNNFSSPNYGNSPNNDNYDHYDPDNDNDNAYGNNNNCYNNNLQQHQNNNNMMSIGRNNQRGGNQAGGGGGGGAFRDNRNNRRGGNPQGQNRNFAINRNSRNNFRRNRNNNVGGGNQNRGGIVE